MAPTRKPADRRQNRATKDVVVELVAAPTAPEAPDRWLPDTVGEWDLFWADEQLVSVVRESHRPALTRLFDWRDRLRRAWEQADALRDAVADDAHVVAGSTGQVRVNPLYEQAEKAEARALQIEGRIEALEDRFGLSPGSLLKLGVDFQRRQNLEATNARMMEAMRGSHDASAGPVDPRSLPGDSAVDAS